MAKTTTFKMIETAAELNKEIASIKGDVSKIEARIHVAAVSCLMHADKHGDITLMRSLVDALGKSQRKNALLDWAQAFGKFVYNEETKVLDYSKLATTDLDGAIEQPFYTFKPEQAYQQFDMAGALASLLKKAEKAAQSNDQKVPVPEQALIELRRLAATVAPTKASA